MPTPSRRTPVEDGKLRSRGRVASRLDARELFAPEVGPDDRVALEVTGNAWTMARILEPYVARVIVASPTDTGIRRRARGNGPSCGRAPARLLWSGELDGVDARDERVRVMRRDRVPGVASGG
jgi:transposase